MAARRFVRPITHLVKAVGADTGISSVVMWSASSSSVSIEAAGRHAAAHACRSITGSHRATTCYAEDYASFDVVDCCDVLEHVSNLDRVMSETASCHLGPAGTTGRPLVGLGPRTKLLTLVSSFVSAKRGRITYGELSRRLNVGRAQSTSISYMGFAIKEDPA